MNIIAQNMQGGNPQIGSLLFTDSFQRVDQPFYMGNDWSPCIYPGTTNPLTGGNQVAAGINVAANRLSIGSLSANNIIFGFIPRNLDGRRLQSLPQASQYHLLTDNSAAATTRIGPGVLLQPNAGLGYFAQIIFVSLVVRITALSVGGDTRTILGAAIAIAAGDTIKIDGTVASGGGSVTVNLWKNGVLSDTVVDAGASRSTSGMPGIMVYSAQIGATQTLDLYRGGFLPLV